MNSLMHCYAMTGTVATPDCDTCSFYLEELSTNGMYFPSVIRKAICLFHQYA